jgi:chloramphenicol-sensitive protein RarD
MSSPVAAPPEPADRPSQSGIVYAIGAYSFWGFVPIYWKAVQSIPAMELLAPRIFWTAALLFVILAASGKLGEIRPERLALLKPIVLAAVLISINWCIFIYAVNSDQVVATSLGYYINPLVSIILGLVVLGERLHKAQTLAVLLAAAGVVYFTVSTGSLPWISVALASSFALYGLVHKMVHQPPLVGLMREMTVLLPMAGCIMIVLYSREGSSLADAPLDTHALVALSGAVTAIPLFLFRAATQRLPLFAVGMFQYIAPTLTLGLAVVVYDEPFTTTHIISFTCVWVGLAIFTADAFWRARRSASESGPS